MHFKFEWDEKKNLENLQKHGVNFQIAQFAFLDQKRVVADDRAHSIVEKRHYCFGKVKGGILTVRFTYRDNVVRIIGAGYWRRGKKIYEKQNKLHR